MSSVVRVVAALIASTTRPGAYWVQQRAPGGSRPLQWEFPGGKVEPGESDVDALVRECREELQVELTVGRLRGSTRHQYPELTIELVLYDARIAHGTPRCVAGHALREVTLAEMASMPFCEADVPLIEALRLEHDS